MKLGYRKKITFSLWFLPHDPVFVISDATNNSKATVARHHAVHSQYSSLECPNLFIAADSAIRHT